MSAGQKALLGRGLLTGAGLGIVVLLVLFHAVVSGAVERSHASRAGAAPSSAQVSAPD